MHALQYCLQIQMSNCHNILPFTFLQAPLLTPREVPLLQSHGHAHFLYRPASDMQVVLGLHSQSDNLCVLQEADAVGMDGQDYEG